jgi:hypothetical protein
MRSTTSHAAVSSVGEHTARESECAQRVCELTAKDVREGGGGPGQKVRPL